MIVEFKVNYTQVGRVKNYISNFISINQTTNYLKVF